MTEKKITSNVFSVTQTADSIDLRCGNSDFRMLVTRNIRDLYDIEIEVAGLPVNAGSLTDIDLRRESYRKALVDRVAGTAGSVVGHVQTYQKDELERILRQYVGAEVQVSWR